jgi:hypothetical protein
VSRPQGEAFHLALECRIGYAMQFTCDLACLEKRV